MPAIEEWSFVTSNGLDTFVARQQKRPMNFKDLTENLLEQGEASSSDHKFFLAMLAAMAIMRLAE